MIIKSLLILFLALLFLPLNLEAGVELNGTDQQCYATDHPSIDFQGAMTVACWIRPDFDENEAAAQIIIDKQFVTADTAYRLTYTASINDFRFKLGLVSGSLTCDTTGLDWTAGEWHHIAATFDENDDPTEMNIYWDGDLEASTDTPTESILVNNDTLLLGERNDGTDASNFDGIIDEFFVDGRAWSANEIKLLYTSRTRYIPIQMGFETGYGFYCPMDDYADGAALSLTDPFRDLSPTQQRGWTVGGDGATGSGGVLTYP